MLSARIGNRSASPPSYIYRPFSASPQSDEKKKGEEEGTSGDADGADEEQPKKKKSLRDSVDGIQGNETGESSKGGFDTSGVVDDETKEKIAGAATSFFSALSDTWKELVQAGAPKDINKKLGDPNFEDDDAAADKYEGTSAIMIIDPEEHLTAWERMERRLKDAPIIQNILERSEELYVKTGANKARERADDLREDAREAWETSQNPWVYRASSVYDTLTAETEYAAAVRELRVLDPEFSLENWKHDVVGKTLPRIMELFLEGRIKELEPWLGESVYNRLAAEVRARKKEGVKIDTNVLAIMNAEIMTCEPDEVNKGSPIILIHFMCQQINCVRKKKSKKEKEADAAAAKEAGEDTEEEGERSILDEELGEIVEGSEDDIRANSYVVAFQREYDEEKMELNWKIVDFRFNGAIAYL